MNIDILKYPTLPSLTFAGYRANNLVEHVVPKINGYLHDFIKHSYYGGITETYKPAGKNVKSYDVNSLYPSAMRDNYYPCGSPYLFTGAVDISTFRYLGFFRVRVTAPDNLKKPTLPFHAITDAGGRTIFPTGT